MGCNSFLMHTTCVECSAGSARQLPPPPSHIALTFTPSLQVDTYRLTSVSAAGVNMVQPTWVRGMGAARRSSGPKKGAVVVCFSRPLAATGLLMPRLDPAGQAAEQVAAHGCFQSGMTLDLKTTCMHNFWPQ